MFVREYDVKIYVPPNARVDGAFAASRRVASAIERARGGPGCEVRVDATTVKTRARGALNRR